MTAGHRELPDPRVHCEAATPLGYVEENIMFGLK